MEIRSIGSYLKELRESKGITLQDVQQATKISSFYLNAIEADEFEKLPAPAYAKGFMKIYAEFIGADKDWVISEYAKSHVDESKQVLIIEGEDMEKKGLRYFIRAIDPRIWAGIGVGLLLLFIIFKLFFSTSVNSIMKGELSEEHGWNPGSQVIQPAGVSEPITAVTVPKKGEKLSLEGKANEDVWIRVQADGDLLFEQILKKGQKESWYASKELKVRVGNSDNISFVFNGEPLTKLSQTGKVLNIRFTEKGWWISE